MNQHTVQSYDHAIENIYQNLYQMYAHTLKMTQIAYEAFSTNDKLLVLKVFEKDKKINELDSKIEKSATTMLALRQPVGIDLRLTISAIKLAVIIERVGDLIKNTTARVSKIKLYPDQFTYQGIEIMFLSVINIQNKALQVLERKDLAEIPSIFKEDDELDRLYYEIIAHTQAKIVSNSMNTAYFLEIIFAAKNLERIGDYYVKIVNIVNYIVTGKIIEESNDPKVFCHIDKIEGN